MSLISERLLNSSILNKILELNLWENCGKIVVNMGGSGIAEYTFFLIIIILSKKPKIFYGKVNPHSLKKAKNILWKSQPILRVKNKKYFM